MNLPILASRSHHTTMVIMAAIRVIMVIKANKEIKTTIIAIIGLPTPSLNLKLLVVVQNLLRY